MESAREIFNQCCIDIAATLSPRGFRYLPSKHSAIKECGDLKFEIRFQSSRRNFLAPDSGAGNLKQLVSKFIPSTDLVTFGNVTLIEHASVYSKKLRDFRRSVPGAWATNDAITGGQIGNLQSPAKWVEFNLANPHTRSSVIDAACRLIDDVAIPYFEIFKDPPDVVARLLTGSMPWMWEPSALEYVHCFGGIYQARQLLDKFVNESDDRASVYRLKLLNYKAEGTPEAWDSTAPARLAKAAIILGLDGS